MHVFYIILIASLIAFGINGFIFQRAIVSRLMQLDAPLKAEKMPSLTKAFFGAIFVCLIQPLLGVFVLFHSMRHHMAIGFVKGYLNDRIISETDATEVYSWVIEEFPPNGMPR